MLDTRFHDAPLEVARPWGAPRLEAWSPKLRRVVRLYSRAAFELWLLLESDPDVLHFCERPLYIESLAAKRLADFWVRYRHREELLVLDLEPPSLAQGSAGADSLSRPESVEHGQAERLKVRYVPAVDLLAARAWTRNWERMLPYLVANEGLVGKALLRDVLGFATQPKPLTAIERHFAGIDLVLVRTGAFHLLHRGKLDASALRTAALCASTTFVATEAMR